MPITATIKGNYDKSQNFDPNKPGTSFLVENQIIVNTPYQLMKDYIISNSAYPYITISSNLYDRIDGLQSYLHNVNTEVNLVLPEELYVNLGIYNSMYDWDSFQYAYKNHKVAYIPSDVSMNKESFLSTDLYNAMRQLANAGVTYLIEDTIRDVHIFYIRLSELSCQTIKRFAVGFLYVTPDNTEKELIIVSDYKDSSKLRNFINSISSNFTKIRIAQYFSTNPLGEDMTQAEYDSLDPTYKSLVVLVNDNDATKINTNL